MADKTHSEPGTPGVLSRLAGIAVVAVVLAGIYVGYQALQVLFPPNTYETAMLATVEDTVSADGVLLFDETYISGSGTLGYLAADGERVSAGAGGGAGYMFWASASRRALRWPRSTAARNRRASASSSRP